MLKKTIMPLLRLICLILVLAVLFATFYYLVKSKKLLLNKAFVSSQAMLGVDISSYQADVDMDALAAQGVRFAYIKATEGSSFVDPMFAVNWKNARSSRLLVGAYHFFSFESGGDTQARNYIKTVGELSGCLVPAVDVEYYGNLKNDPPAKSDVVEQLGLCLDMLEEAYGMKPMIYCSRGIYEDYLEGVFDEYPFWVRSVYYPAPMDGWEDWTVWQYCDRGLLEGYSGGEKYIDLNVFSLGKSVNALLLP